MSRTNAYDLVIIGGGIAGSSLACSMAKAGARVLLLECEIEFRDRVRGEILCPWGSGRNSFARIVRSSSK